jgi:hypothetical protein
VGATFAALSTGALASSAGVAVSTASALALALGNVCASSTGCCVVVGAGRAAEFTTPAELATASDLLCSA